MSFCSTFPIAIIGVACRLPGGVHSLDTLWPILIEGRDVVTEVPSARWETSRYVHPRRDMPGRTVSVRAGIVDDMYAFDPAFFGLSRTEAESMDPQQQLLLELAWEALEDAGIRPSTLSGSDTAVFVGAASPDAGTCHADDICATTPYSMTGTNLSIISNRISYIYNFHGPSMTIDTACSSAMHALAQACQTLASGGAGMALAGGVNALLAPYPFVGFSQAHMLSPEGRCKVFDASGDGYVRAEGGGFVLLQPLDAAIQQGRRIHAVIRGIGCNSDGRTQGIALPSAAAQETLLREVYAAAQCSADQLAYMEAHGTGTAAGDPVEALAIGRALGQQRQSPLWVGSVKCNLGHLETASAMAGIMKALLVLREKRIPGQIHLQRINPAIDCKKYNLRFPLRSVPLPRVDGLPLVGVNSFGFGGANGHVLLEAGLAPVRRRRVHAVPPIFLSARSEESLRALARAYAQRMTQSPEEYYDLAVGAVFRREALSRRLVVEGSSPEEVAAVLTAVAAGQETGASSASMGEVPTSQAVGQRTAFVFSGNGGQWAGMGRAMLDIAAFRNCAEEIAALMRPLSGKDVLETLRTATPEDMTHTDTAQQLLFLVQMGLCAALDAVGISADMAFGHSVGEVAAACYCGKLTLKEAVRVIYYRSLHQEQTRNMGRMAAASMNPEEALRLARRFGDVELAGINAADAVTLSGDGQALAGLGEELKARHIFFKMLPLEYAFHSTRMDGIRNALIADLRGLRSHQMRHCFISTVTGTIHDGACPASYWWDNVRKPVNFHAAVQCALDEGARHFLEIGPHSILLRYVRSGMSKARCAEGRTVDGWVGGTLLRHSGIEQFHMAWRLAWAHGWPLHMQRHFPLPGNALSLPTYPWNHKDCRPAATPECVGFVANREEHPLLGRRLPGLTVWENVLDLESSPWISDHKVANAVYFPAACFLEMALAAAAKACGEQGRAALCNTSILRPVIFRERQPMVLRTIVDATDGEVRILARPYMRDEPWILHARGRVTHVHCTGASHEAALKPQAFGPPMSAAELYGFTEKANMHYGPVFRPLECCWRQEDALLARFAPSEAQGSNAWEAGMLLPPPLLDGGLQLLFPLIASWLDLCPAPRLPYWFSRCILFAPGRPDYALVRRTHASRRTVVCDLSLLDAEGHELLRLEGGHARTMENLAALRPSAYATYYIPQPHPQSALPENLPTVEDLACVVREEARILTASATWRHYRDEVLPLREVAALALARELEGHACAGELAACLCRNLAQRQSTEVASSFVDALPPFTEVWRTLVVEASQDAAANMLLANVRKTLLTGAKPTPPDSPLWIEFRRQEYCHDDALVGKALEALLHEASSAARIVEIGAQPACLGRLLAPGLRGHSRILAASSEDTLEQLRLAVEGLTTAAEDASLEVLRWDVERESPPVQAHVAVAFHCLHRADDIPAALRRCRQALHEGGRLILVESAPSLAWDVLFGQDRTWWVTPQSEGCALSRLMTSEEWIKALAQAGFDDIQEVRMDAAVPGFLLLARAAAVPALVSQRQVASSAPVTWLLCAQRSEFAQELHKSLAEAVRERGDALIHVQPGNALRRQGASWQCRTDNADHWKAVWETLAALGRPVICVDALGVLDDKDTADDGLNWGTAQEQCAALSQLARGWDRAGRPTASLCVLTRGAMSCPGADDLRPAQATVLGLARVLMNEMPGLETRCLDIHQNKTEGHCLVAPILRELLQPTEEREIALIGKRRFAARSREVDRSQAAGGMLRLQCAFPGRLETLRWTALPLSEPGEGEVRVAVRAIGLNFRDVMWAMNLLPEEALEKGFSGPGLGIECAGVLDAVGPGVEGLKPGQRVLCFGPRCFASHVLTTAQAVAPMPDAWSFAEAATVPVAFFTAWYALQHLARLQDGERVLIHGAAGGVGLAAVQIAASLGLEVFATAGSEDKRHMLRLLGVEHVYDSRSLAFHDEILRDTAGQGVDAVLNSLAGEGMDQSLRLLRPFGRFLELGKRDFYADKPLRLRPFRDNVSYFGIDVDQLMKEKPELGLCIFRELMERFAAGQWHPLQHSLYAANEVEYAFRSMQQSRHVGKIVVQPPAASASGQVDVPWSSLPVRRDGSYVVSGGLSGFGLASARHLAVQGAGALVLLSRRGATAENASTLQELRTLGLPQGQERPVLALAQDVTDMDSLRRQLDTALTGLPPLRGILHAAAVLDDGMLAAMTPQRVARVLSPKFGGACNLHRYSLGKELDFFIMYSSATTLLGNPGQANYVAANLGLECLAALRRSQGLPGLAVGWGAIGDAGMLTRDAHALESLRRVTGISPQTADEALEALQGLSAACPAAPAIFAADWKRLARLPLGRSPRFAPLRLDVDKGEGQERSLRDLVADLPPAEALDKVNAAVTVAVARILRVPPTSIKTGTPLSDMGMDSLMAMELVLSLEEMLDGQSLAGGLSAGASIRDVAARVYGLLCGSGDTESDMRVALESSHGIAVNDALAGAVFKEAENAHATHQ
ncbi:MAG: SDR family NAD(P)-dependent oxidoreductase [Desulfovibrio sp.]|nr:SDR family NAD(P)-dependent oxidoreductase [Desulfovibrio sp.]